MEANHRPLQKSLKCILLHNGNKLASIPIGHSVQMKETYKNMKTTLDTIICADHEWVISEDLKMLSMILGQQGGTQNTHALCACGTAEQKTTTFDKKGMV